MIEPLLGEAGEARGWHLRAGGTSYVLALCKGRYVVHHHWGSAMAVDLPSLARLAAPPEGFGVADDLGDRSYSLNRLPQDYPWPLGGDFRSPAISAELVQGGAPALDFAYRGWRLLPGIPDWGGLPLPHDGGPEGPLEGLELDLEDGLTGLRLSLLYLVAPATGVIVRAARLENHGKEAIRIRRALSFSLDLPPSTGDLDLWATEGAWARERQLEPRRLGPGRLELGSRKGVSGHSSSPVLLLATPGTGEEWGEAWAASLLYSGDWILGIERSEDGGWRLQGGLHPELLSWTLAPGETFHTPAVALAHGERGLAELSDRLHGFAVANLLAPRWARQDRPVLLNSWEATYFDFDEDSLVDLAGQAAGLGAELFVLDDGWFGDRVDDKTSLGDWQANPLKLPSGLAALAGKVRALGLDFGLWIEPEAVSRKSALYREHPDWVLALEGREEAEGRNQLVLDLGRPEVRDHLLSAIVGLVEEAGIAYLKWDMNRPLSRVGSRTAGPGEARHRQVLGLYALLGSLTKACPGLLIEGCAGGGGRLDWGLLPYFAQFWLSDNTDPTWRAPMQDAASLFFPPLAITAHLSASPNHQTGRVTGLAARSRVAMAGNFGLELDPRRLTAEEAEAVRKDLSWYRSHRRLLQQGIHRRLGRPGPGGDWARLVVAPDGRRAVLLWMATPGRPNQGSVRLRLPGLRPDLLYTVTSPDLAGLGSPAIPGSELLARGLEFEPGPGPEPRALAFDLEATPLAGNSHG